jgi:protein-disulfide isomerase
MGFSTTPHGEAGKSSLRKITALMLRRFLVTLLRRSVLVLWLICLGCSAQSTSPDTTRSIERQVRHYYHLPPEVQIVVGPLHPSEFGNYDALKITMVKGAKKDEYDFLLSKDGKTLIRLNKFDLTKDPYAEVMKKIDINGRPTRGNKDAKVVAVNFDDFQCPFCSRMHQTLFPQILHEYGDRVLFVYKDYPLDEIHPWATHAAVNANCLAGQNNDAYWLFADTLHADPREVNGQSNRDAQFATLDRIALQLGERFKLDMPKLQACVKAQKDEAIKASLREGEALGVDATPTMFINGEEINGALPINEMRAVLDRALSQAGVPPPVHPASVSAPAGGSPPGR